MLSSTSKVPCLEPPFCAQNAPAWFSTPPPVTSVLLLKPCSPNKAQLEGLLLIETILDSSTLQSELISSSRLYEKSASHCPPPSLPHYRGAICFYRTPSSLTEGHPQPIQHSQQPQVRDWFAIRVCSILGLSRRPGLEKLAPLWPTTW